MPAESAGALFELWHGEGEIALGEDRSFLIATEVPGRHGRNVLRVLAQGQSAARVLKLHSTGRSSLASLPVLW